MFQAQCPWELSIGWQAKRQEPTQFQTKMAQFWLCKHKNIHPYIELMKGPHSPASLPSTLTSCYINAVWCITSQAQVSGWWKTKPCNRQLTGESILSLETFICFIILEKSLTRIWGLGTFLFSKFILFCWSYQLLKSNKWKHNGC